MRNSKELSIVIKLVAQNKNIKIGKMLSDCGLNKNALSTMQSGGYLPRTENIVKIADYLDCSVDYLLGRTDNPDSHKISKTETPMLSVAVRAARSSDDKPIEIVERDESKFINAPAKKL